MQANVEPPDGLDHQEGGNSNFDQTFDRKIITTLEVVSDFNKSVTVSDNIILSENRIDRLLQKADKETFDKLSPLLPGAPAPIQFLTRLRKDKDGNILQIHSSIQLYSAEAVELARSAFPQRRPNHPQWLKPDSPVKYFWPAPKQVPTPKAFAIRGAKGKLSEEMLRAALKKQKATLCSYKRLSSSGTRFPSASDMLAVIKTAGYLPNTLPVGETTYRLFFIHPAAEEEDGNATQSFAAKTRVVNYQEIQARGEIMAALQHARTLSPTPLDAEMRTEERDENDEEEGRKDEGKERKDGEDGRKEGEDGRKEGEEGRTDEGKERKEGEEGRKVEEEGRKEGEEGRKDEGKDRKKGEEGRKEGEDGTGAAGEKEPGREDTAGVSKKAKKKAAKQEKQAAEQAKAKELEEIFAAAKKANEAEATAAAEHAYDLTEKRRVAPVSSAARTPVTSPRMRSPNKRRERSPVSPNSKVGSPSDQPSPNKRPTRSSSKSLGAEFADAAGPSVGLPAGGEAPFQQ